MSQPSISNIKRTLADSSVINSAEKLCEVSYQITNARNGRIEGSEKDINAVLLDLGQKLLKHNKSQQVLECINSGTNTYYSHDRELREPFYKLASDAAHKALQNNEIHVADYFIYQIATKSENPKTLKANKYIGMDIAKAALKKGEDEVMGQQIYNALNSPGNDNNTLRMLTDLMRDIAETRPNHIIKALSRALSGPDKSTDLSGMPESKKPSAEIIERCTEIKDVSASLLIDIGKNHPEKVKAAMDKALENASDYTKELMKKVEDELFYKPTTKLGNHYKAKGDLSTAKTIDKISSFFGIGSK